MYGIKPRCLPGTLAPMYQELARGCRVIAAQSSQCCIQPASAVSVGSITVAPRCCMCVRQSPIQSTCCSIDTIMFENTDGLCGPVMVKKFGSPVVINPR